MSQETGNSTTKRILITGGTGTLGRAVVELLTGAGEQVRVLSRRGGHGNPGVEFVRGDLASGGGVDAAVEGVTTIVHCAGTASGDETKAANLVRAAAGAHISHLVFISVVGTDRIPVNSPIDRVMFGYFGSKAAAERVIAESGLPYTTLRATQFHQLLFMVASQMAKLPLMPALAGVSFQPIDAAEVAVRLAELALAEPAGLVPAMGGPRIISMRQLLRAHLRAVGRRRPIVPVWQPGAAARAFRSGANLAPDRAVGSKTWEHFLAERVSDRASGRAGQKRFERGATRR